MVLGSLTVGIGAYNAVTGIKTAMEAANTTTLHGLAAAQLKANLAFLASPITWVVAGITLLVGGFIYLWNTSEEFRGFWIGLWDDITGFFGDAKEKISEGIDNIGGFFTSLPDKISGGISDFKESVKAGSVSYTHLRTNSPKGKDGLRSGIVIFNEIHQYENYDNIDVFTTGLGKKKHPRRSYFTTNGDKREGPDVYKRQA